MRPATPATLLILVLAASRAGHALPPSLSVTPEQHTASGAGAHPTAPGSTHSNALEPLTSDQRIHAATLTATQNPQCRAIEPFYWEIGDKDGSRVSGTVGGKSPDGATPMPVASASKLVFGAYVAQLRQGGPTPADIQALTMRTGYTSFKYPKCIRLLPFRQKSETVDECFHSADNGAHTAANDGRFFYDGGHFQKYADIDLGLGGLNNEGLSKEISSRLGADVHLSFLSPQLAGGVEMAPSAYAHLLQKILAGQLKFRDWLGKEAVCTNPATCPSAASTPIPPGESWHYSLGHWVEDDPVVGDGAFSSPGAFGFYPWIDSSKTCYGVLARHKLAPRAYYQSVQCGRLIRKAWLSGTALP